MVSFLTHQNKTNTDHYMTHLYIIIIILSFLTGSKNKILNKFKSQKYPLTLWKIIITTLPTVVQFADSQAT